jgi:hypothetical protein
MQWCVLMDVAYRGNDVPAAPQIFAREAPAEAA